MTYLVFSIAWTANLRTPSSTELRTLVPVLTARCTHSAHEQERNHIDITSLQLAPMQPCRPCSGLRPLHRSVPSHEQRHLVPHDDLRLPVGNIGDQVGEHA